MSATLEVDTTVWRQTDERIRLCWGYYRGIGDCRAR